MERYRNQLKEESQAEILEQYKNHVAVMNVLFGCRLPEPIKIDPEPRLLIVGFDRDQKRGRLEKNIEVLRDKHVKVYKKGDQNDIEVQTLWRDAK
jgi:hypothetical protein